VRLIFGLKGETVVCGSSPGCVIYNFPYVQFTSEQQKELRRRSDKSPDDYALACTSGDYFKLDFPAASTWTNHALLTWGATRLTWIAVMQRERAETTNATVSVAAADAAVNTARQVVALARSAHPTNGALWLAEAAACFAAHDDLAAVTALENAAAHWRWSADTENVFTNLANIYERTGLSRLDASTEASSHSAHDFMTYMQGIINRQLNRLMATAINEGGDEKFGKLLGLLVELRKAEWQDKHVGLLNIFRNFIATDELIVAMAKRLDRTLPTRFAEAGMAAQPYYDENRQFRTRVFSDFLDERVEPRIAARFWGQRDMVGALKKYRRQAEQFQFTAFIHSFVRSNIAGVASLFLLGFLLLAAISELPFVWLRKIGSPPGAWPRQRTFWFAMLVAMSVGALISFRIFSALGIGNSSQSSFGIYEEPPAITPALEALLSVFLLVGAWHLFLIVLKTGKKPVSSWPAVALIADLYFLTVLLAGFFRDGTVAALTSAYF